MDYIHLGINIKSIELKTGGKDKKVEREREGGRGGVRISLLVLCRSSGIYTDKIKIKRDSRASLGLLFSAHVMRWTSSILSRIPS